MGTYAEAVTRLRSLPNRELLPFASDREDRVAYLILVERAQVAIEALYDAGMNRGDISPGDLAELEAFYAKLVDTSAELDRQIPFPV